MSARLARRWRDRAEQIRPYAPAVAQAIEDCAHELENGVCDEGDDLLTLRAAARVSGYDEDWLGRLVKQGRLPNAGRPRAPRIRRRDLPRKPGYVPPAEEGLAAHA